MLSESFAVMINFHSTSSEVALMLNSNQINFDIYKIGAGMLLGSGFLLHNNITPVSFLMNCKKRAWRSAKLKVKSFDSEFILKFGSWKADIHVTKNK
ncbi:hypothetical protein CYR55_10950 [Chimaeribacter californicus]|uniref:Uncharacterized protein n=1 Tax=Chimaeribacter californicus TaxID=2060067 RepID=A0A2N5E5X5_9GAMM|nr:hypothetical protein [Chimaeribacter californicus]PLR36722.1 hypothetical protein CYR55_10950 [Chimaeribacter californicus]